MIIGCARHEHASRRAKLLKARRNVHPVAQQVLSFHHHVAEVYADAEHNATFHGHIDLLLGDGLLHGDRTGHRIDDGRELNDLPVAHELDNAAPEFGEEGINDLRAKRRETSKRRSFVGLNQPRVAHNIGGHDGR